MINAKTIIGVADKFFKKYYKKNLIEFRLNKLCDRIQNENGTYLEDLNDEIKIAYLQGFIDASSSLKLGNKCHEK